MGGTKAIPTADVPPVRRQCHVPLFRLIFFIPFSLFLLPPVVFLAGVFSGSRMLACPVVIWTGSGERQEPQDRTNIEALTLVLLGCIGFLRVS